jgi:tRNA (guanine10-N2)-dimethyltransferase
LKNRSLVLLSGEGTTLPEAEARAVFLAYDPGSSFESPEKRVLIVESEVDPYVVGARIAFARRVGHLVEDVADAEKFLSGKTVRLRNFDLGEVGAPPDPKQFLRGLDLSVDLANPGRELTSVRGRDVYLAVTDPSSMRQGWSLRRPRARNFFHPSAIFPKLSRALVNLTRCREGSVFLDPFAGTGSLAIEASLVGAEVVVLDRAERMVRGASVNMKQFGQRWLGIVRADSYSPPLAGVDAIATDVPYGRVSSTGGKKRSEVLEGALKALPDLLSAGARLVIMHPNQEPVEESGRLELEEEHSLYVHKLLTRTISVLRRR